MNEEKQGVSTRLIVNQNEGQWVKAEGSQDMKFAILILYVVFACSTWANTNACFSIKDPDRKNVCLAMSKRQNSYCYSVKESDTKNMCLANVMQQQSYCYSIKMHDMKQQCLAQVK
jgi:uncharacterized protein involved in tellurium resistance